MPNPYQPLSQASSPGGLFSSIMNKIIPVSNPMGTAAKSPQANVQTASNSIPSNMAKPAPTSGTFLGKTGETAPKNVSPAPASNLPPSPTLTPEQKANNERIASGGFQTSDVLGNTPHPSATTAPVNTPPQTTPNVSTPAPAPTPQPVTYPGLVGQLANQGNSNYNQIATGASMGLYGSPEQNKVYADRAKQIADAAGQKISDIGGQGARGEAGYLTTGTSPVGEGNAAILAQTTAAQQQAISQGANAQLAGNAQGLTAQSQGQSGLSNAANVSLTGQGTAQSALGTAAGYAQPVQVSPGNALVNPQTGGESYSGLGGLTGYGIAKNNISMGDNFTAQAADLDKTLKQIDTLTPNITSFLTQTGLNNDRTPAVNAKVNDYISNIQNPAAIRGGLQLFMNELKNYEQQIIAKSGLTPTDAGYQVATTDPTNLNIKDLVPFINNLRQIGQSRWQPLNDAARNSYASGNNPYTGNSPQTSNPQNTAPDISGKDIVSSIEAGNVPKAAIGTIGSILSGGSGIVTGLADWLSKL